MPTLNPIKALRYEQAFKERRLARERLRSFQIAAALVLSATGKSPLLDYGAYFSDVGEAASS
jgi:hypothetical protein